MNRTSGEYQRAVSEMVGREVHYCASSLVHTLSRGYGEALPNNRDLGSLIDQAFELASPVPDYEEAASNDGWKGPFTDKYGATYFTNETESEQNMTWAAPNWEALCRDFDIEPYDREVYEHWIVSNWFGERLAAHGEKVDTDFAGMTIWARTCTGQGIAMDCVVCSIYDELHAKS